MNIYEGFQRRLGNVLERIENLKRGLKASTLGGVPRRLIVGGKRGVLNQLSPLAQRIVEGNISIDNTSGNRVVSDLTRK